MIQIRHAIASKLGAPKGARLSRKTDTNWPNSKEKRTTAVSIQAPRNLAAMVLACLLYSSSWAQTQILLDGDFDNLTVGTAPDRGKPNGAWSFPNSYGSTSAGDMRESARLPGMLSIVETSTFDAGRTGLSLQIDNPQTNSPSTVLVNMLSEKVSEDDGGILRLKFDTFVPQGDRTGGPVVLLASVCPKKVHTLNLSGAAWRSGG